MRTEREYRRDNPAENAPGPEGGADRINENELRIENEIEAEREMIISKEEQSKGADDKSGNQFSKNDHLRRRMEARGGRDEVQIR